VLQGLMLAFLLVHDWVPLGRLNDIAGVRSQTPIRRNLLNTAVNSIPVALAVGLTVRYVGHPHPVAVGAYLVVLYLLFLIGEYRAWWHPYWFGTTPQMVRRYQAMFGNTHTFLPRRHGFAPNTAHVALHLATLVTFVLVVLRIWLVRG
jgi:hypothetical protein